VEYSIKVEVIKLSQWLKNIRLAISIYMIFVMALLIVLYKVKNAIRQNII